MMDEQRRNCARLAVWLIDHKDSLPVAFDMRYRAASGGREIKPSQVIESATSCCPLGLGLFAGITPNRDDWHEYEKQFVDSPGPGYWFLYGAHWPDDPHQAAVRAAKLALTGVVPDGDYRSYTYNIPHEGWKYRERWYLTDAEWAIVREMAMGRTDDTLACIMLQEER